MFVAGNREIRGTVPEFHSSIDVVTAVCPVYRLSENVPYLLLI